MTTFKKFLIRNPSGMMTLNRFIFILFEKKRIKKIHPLNKMDLLDLSGLVFFHHFEKGKVILSFETIKFPHRNSYVHSMHCFYFNEKNRISRRFFQRQILYYFNLHLKQAGLSFEFLQKLSNKKPK